MTGRDNSEDLKDEGTRKDPNKDNMRYIGGEGKGTDSRGDTFGPEESYSWRIHDLNARTSVSILV